MVYGANMPVPVVPVWRLMLLCGWARSRVAPRALSAWANCCHFGSCSRKLDKGNQRFFFKTLRSLPASACQALLGRLGKGRWPCGSASDTTAKGWPWV